jgi:hypothetical protein
MDSKKVRSVDLPAESTADMSMLTKHDASLNPIAHPLSGLSKEERIAKIRSAVGGCQDDPEIADIFTAIDQERHAYPGRAIATFDDEWPRTCPSTDYRPNAERFFQ